MLAFSNGISKLLPLIAVVVGYTVTFYLLSVLCKPIPVEIVGAILLGWVVLVVLAVVVA